MRGWWAVPLLLVVLSGCQTKTDSTAPPPSPQAKAPTPAPAPPPAAAPSDPSATYSMLLLMPNGLSCAKSLEAGARSVAGANETSLTVAQADAAGNAFADAVKANAAKGKLSAVLLAGADGTSTKAALEAAKAAKAPVVVLGGAVAGDAVSHLAPNAELKTLDDPQAAAVGRVAVETAFAQLHGDKVEKTKALSDIH